MTARRMIMTTEKVEYLVKQMSAKNLKVIGEEEPGWTVIEITVDTPADILDIFFAGILCGLKRAQKELTV